MKRRIVPSASGGRPPGKQSPTANVGKAGILNLNTATQRLLGNPEKVSIFVDTEAEPVTIWLEPTTPADAGGWTVAGGGSTGFRIAIKAEVTSHPQMVGEYKVIKQARSLLLVQKDEENE